MAINEARKFLLEINESSKNISASGMRMVLRKFLDALEKQEEWCDCRTKAPLYKVDACGKCRKPIKPDTSLEDMPLEPEVQEVNLLGEFDGLVWAKEFMQRFNKNDSDWIDESLMLGWFANAIMAGYDHAKKEKPEGQEYEFCNEITEIETRCHRAMPCRIHKKPIKPTQEECPCKFCDFLEGCTSMMLDHYSPCKVRNTWIKGSKPTQEDSKGDWTPKKGEYYFWISNQGEIEASYWNNFEWEKDIKRFLGIYRGEAEAIKMRDLIKQFVNKQQNETQNN